MNALEIWRNVLGELEVSVSRPNFQTWFKGTFILDYKKGIFIIGVPNIFAESWLKQKHLKDIIKSLQNQTGEEVLGLKFKVATPPPGQEVDFKMDKVVHNPVDKPVAKEAVRVASQSLPTNSTLGGNYKFENFIVGSSNQLAHAAAMAVAGKPGELYNPLFIYGDSGLGKTHLMQAIGHTYLSNNPNGKVLYVSTETFINEFINAVESGFGKAKDFKDRYRNVDLLLIDDIQFLSRKESTQEEFFHTFNHLHQNKKQVVLTADCPPKAIKGLEVRLQTRFEGGMVTDISLPDVETREAILRHKAKKQNKEVPPEAIHYIAENIQSSIRELEGALTKVIATCELTGIPITVDKVAEILGGLIRERRQTITPELIIREVHRYYRLPIEEILGKKRNKEVVIPRQITMYLLRHEANLSYPEIGREMSGKDHSTVMHGCKTIESGLADNSKVKDDLTTIKDRIYAALK